MKSAHPFEVIVFDLDGLLVDSEPLQYRAFDHVFSRYGFPLTMEHYRRWRDWKLTARWIAHHGLSLDPEIIREEKRAVYDALMREELALKPGARAAVERLGEGSRLAIASGSGLDSIRACLEKFGLSEHFQALVSTGEVPRGKPHPDVFDEALARLRATPARAVVIENSANGMRAAHAAGMACVVCPDRFAPEPREAYAEAALIVETLDEVTPAALSALGGKET